MRAALDAWIYGRQERGGVTRLFNEILPRMCWMEDDLEIEMWTSGTLAQPLPAHERISRCRLASFSGRFWSTSLGRRWLPRVRQWDFDRRTGSGDGALWHFTYGYLGLPRHWRGPKLLTVYDLLFEQFPDRYKQYRTRVMPLRAASMKVADCIICISESTRRDLLTCYPETDPERTVVIPLACSDVFREPLEGGECDSLPVPDRYLLYVGGRYWHKNFDLVLRAYARWPLRRQVPLVVAGAPFKPAERERLEKLGLDNEVHWAGMVDDRSLCRLYRGAKALLFPSRLEGFGIPLLEAMACECPIVASDIPSTREVAGDIPLYFGTDDEASLRVAMDSAVNGVEQERIARGRDQATRFTWNQTARRTIEMYRELMGR